MIPEISPTALQEELASEDPPILIDVRDEEELSISQFPEFVHIPLWILHTRLSEIDLDENYVVVCKTGEQSERATEFLLQSGFTRVRYLAGGINAWASSVDPSMAQY